MHNHYYAIFQIIIQLIIIGQGAMKTEESMRSFNLFTHVFLESGSVH